MCEENNDKEEVMDGTTKLGTLGHKHTADHASKMGRRISWDFKNEWIGFMIKYFISEVAGPYYLIRGGLGSNWRKIIRNLDDSVRPLHWFYLVLEIKVRCFFFSLFPHLFGW